MKQKDVHTQHFPHMWHWWLTFRRNGCNYYTSTSSEWFC